MSTFIIRDANIDDAPFLVDTIIEAEKSGTSILTYTTIFGLSESDARKYITLMFEEEIDGCEFSISSFLITEYNGKPVAAVGGWVEGVAEDMPSKVLYPHSFAYRMIDKLFPKLIGSWFRVQGSKVITDCH